ncbi:hypothetical protein BpHYR1_020664 [Brachionus plicatilis]|uniref:Uncharacterized protein n=1 Tax=Brachionus plicatilis TaxID=10195 RepID=A0A3M7T6Y2_BRAPC|nr:hypothetical protein BpHYR1_020664 [Brachionus plicatilis]
MLCIVLRVVFQYFRRSLGVIVEHTPWSNGLILYRLDAQINYERIKSNHFHFSIASISHYVSQHVKFIETNLICFRLDLSLFALVRFHVKDCNDLQSSI